MNRIISALLIFAFSLTVRATPIMPLIQVSGPFYGPVVGASPASTVTTNHARSFNGSSDYLQSASALTALGTGFSTLSIAFDAYIPSYTNTDGVIAELSSYQAPSPGTFRIDPDCSSPSGYFCIGTVATYNTTPVVCYFTRPSAAAWHHYVMVIYNGGASATCVIYVDGSSQTVSYVNLGGVATNFVSDTLNVGADIYYGSRYFFNGYVSRLAFFQGALSSGNASSFSSCVSPTVLSSATLLYYWPINQTSPELPTTGSINLNVSGTTNVASPCTF